MKQDVAKYMKYYNLDRLHSANEDLSPVDFEKGFYGTARFTYGFYAVFLA
jgi:transposase InsO family protein